MKTLPANLKKYLEVISAQTPEDIEENCSEKEAPEISYCVGFGDGKAELADTLLRIFFDKKA